ncbi:MAG TPA: exodeoxyribonuclease I, partial [Ottowia sp.]|nr:exodeoxyribonuclease I [Ottowia sp.]
GFVGDADRARLHKLRALPPGELAAHRTAFDDPRLDELLLRYRARNFPNTLSATEAAHWAEHRRARLIDGEGGALTVQALFDRIDTLAESADDERSQTVLEALYEWGEMMAPEA